MQGNSGRKHYTRAKGYSLEELWNNQVGPNFWERFKNKELGSQKMDQIINSIKEDWDSLDGPNSTIHEQRFKKGLEIFGTSLAESYQNKRSIDSWQEAINPVDVFTALGLRTIEAGGYALDATVGNAARFVSSTLGLDPRWGEVASTGTQLFVGPAALRALPKGYSAASRLAGSQKSLNFASKLNRNIKKGINAIDEATYGIRRVPASNQTITLNKANSIIDDALLPSQNIRRAVVLAKKNKISIEQARDLIDLEDLGIRPGGTINPGSTRNKKISPNPEDVFDISSFSAEDIRNAELALQASGLAAPTSDDIVSYLSEYKTDLTVQPEKEWYNKNFKKTTIHDLHLYGQSPKNFKTYPTFEDAMDAAEVDILTTKLGTKKRWQGLNAKIANKNEYVKFFGTKSEGIKVLPYNKWHQIKKNPFVVPKDVVNKLKKMESRQIDLIDDKPPTVEKITPKGKVIDKPAKIKYDEGTVDQFVKYVNDEIAWQTEQQRLDEDFAKALYKDLGIRYRRGKTVFSRDKSHAVARSEGGPGYTFLEAWWSNQQRGSKEILKPEILAELGIPRTWEEYFYRWYQQQGQAKPITDLGKLADISWDDYERAMNGVPVNQIKIDRRTINHLIQRQIADPTTVNQPGTIGATIGEDFEILVKRTKGLPPDDELLGEINPKEFDLVWRADTYQMGADAKGKFLQEKYNKAFYQRNYRQTVKQKNLEQKKASRETKSLEKKGQGKIFEFFDNLFPDR